MELARWGASTLRLLLGGISRSRRLGLGLVLSLAPGPKTVMDGPTMLAFHAAATFVPFPYSDSDVAIRYLEKRKVNFVVLSDYGRYNVHDTRGGRIRIYELGPAGRPTEGEHLGPAAGESNHVSRIDGP